MHFIKSLFPQSIKNVYHLSQAVLANLFYGFPSRKIKVIGITGTDGKTTTTQMITNILEEAGKSVAMASTINFSIKGKEEKNLSHFTTQSAFHVQKFIDKAVTEGCEYLVLETSSHSLDQYRVWGVQYDVAVITNLTREHLDYHKTIEQYLAAKQKLFENVRKNRGTIVVNLDMENPNEFLKFGANKKFAYTTHQQSSVISNQESEIEKIKAEDIQVGLGGSKFKVNGREFILNLPGAFNIENALAAICVGNSQGISLEIISKAILKIKGVPGRMQPIRNTKGFNIIVDFALTPNALKRLYETLKSSKKPEAKIIAVFGACGERDKGKRPITGKIVSSLADFVILTNDEPYNEEPIKIIEEIFAGVENKIENETCFKIADRRKAIAKALELAKSGDIIAVTGMGNFESMVVGNQKIPWNDQKVIEEELGKM